MNAWATPSRGPLIIPAVIATKERAGSADVTVTIASSTGNGPFGAPQSEYEDVFSLVKTDGTWRLETAPWQLTICPVKGQGP